MRKDEKLSSFLRAALVLQCSKCPKRGFVASALKSEAAYHLKVKGWCVVGSKPVCADCAKVTASE